MKTRIQRNDDCIRLYRAAPAKTEIRLQLSDEELKAIHITPHKCRPRSTWRQGREFYLFSYAKATWAGGGWWDIKAPNRKALDLVIARLIGIWHPAPKQQVLDLRPPAPKPASREVAMAHLERLREILGIKR